MKIINKISFFIADLTTLILVIAFIIFCLSYLFDIMLFSINLTSLIAKAESITLDTSLAFGFILFSWFVLLSMFNKYIVHPFNNEESLKTIPAYEVISEKRRKNKSLYFKKFNRKHTKFS